MADIWLTEREVEKRRQKLDYLKGERRLEIAEMLKIARGFGDLSENAEYDAARERQGLLEAKISELKTLIAGARIIDASKINTDEVALMNKVTIKNIKNGAKMTYTIVGDTEANMREGKISISPPIAKGLLGHKVGDKVEVKVPAGVMQFEILEIGI